MPAARLIAAALRDSPHAASLVARVEATQRAARLIAAPCRELIGTDRGFDPLAPGACELRGETLWLYVSSPTYSAKLRQATPRLLSKLKADGVAVYEIKTRVQPAVTSYPRDGTVSRSEDSSSEMAWPRNGRSAAVAVDALTTRLEESPLKQAAAKLAATLRKRSAR